MKNRMICLLGIVAVVTVLLLNACGTKEGWKRVEIKGYGHIEVPEEWEVSTIDGYVYFSVEKNGKSQPVLVQYGDDFETNPNLSQIKDFEWMQDINYSNSTTLIKNKVHYQDGSTEVLYFLNFWDASIDKCAEFICFDNSIPKKTLEKIAISYDVEDK